MGSISVSEARASLPAVLERVAAGEEVTLTRHGEAVAVVMRPDRVRVRRAAAAAAIADAERLHEMIVESRKRPLSSMPGISRDEAEAHIAELRADRARD
jgi:antitoxin (DNA-binding transcriptional repressor) of toxin-antitoxin stability system